MGKLLSYYDRLICNLLLVVTFSNFCPWSCFWYRRVTTLTLQYNIQLLRWQLLQCLHFGNKMAAKERDAGSTPKPCWNYLLKTVKVLAEYTIQLSVRNVMKHHVRYLAEAEKRQVALWLFHEWTVQSTRRRVGDRSRADWKISFQTELLVICWERIKSGVDGRCGRAKD